ncbi:MAG: sugar ABC transporter substrate-binding protein [Clostridiales bacterium]|nr:sugar ABC transporter substrate-binding protein [Clostridiales bacterium]
MLTKKLTACIVAGAMLVSSIGLAGCSKTNSGSGKGSANGVVNLTYTTWGSTNERKAQGDAIKEFEAKNPNIKVNFQHIPTDYETKLSTMIAAKTPPDVALLNKQTALTWSEQNKIYNLKPLIDKDTEIKEDDYLHDSFVRGGPDKIVGITPCQEVFAIFYNKDMFKAANVDPLPTKAQDALTWDQFVEVAKKLTLDQNGKNASEAGFDPTKIKQYGVFFETWAWQTFLVLNDAKLLTDDYSKLNLSDPAVAETLQKFADLINVYHVCPSPAQAKTLPAPAVALQSKKVAMDYDGQWIQLDLGVAKTNFDVGVLPKIKRCTTTLYGEVEAMFQGTKHSEEAFKLLKWMTNPEGVLDLDSSGLWMPSRKAYYTDPELINKWVIKPGHSDGFKDAVMNQALNDSEPDVGYYLKNDNEIMNIMNSALDQLWMGKKTAAQVLKEIEPKAQAAYKGVYVNK